MLELVNITSLALVDAINPCTLAIQILLLSSLLTARGRKSVLVGGILFSITIYIMYTLYGLGILRAIYAFGIERIVKIVLKGFLLVLAFLEIFAYFRYKPGMISLEMPMGFRPVAKKMLSSVEDPLMALPVAVLCSLLLLPCSSGPYAIMLMIISSYEFTKQLIMILYYNLLFILPMIGITLAIYFGTKPKKVLKWREKHIREIHLISGLLLLLVFGMV